MLNRIALLTLLAAAGVISAAEAMDIKVPFTVYDVTFDRDDIGRMPAAVDAAVWQQAEAGTLSAFPLTSYSLVRYVTRTRTLSLVEEKAGMRRAAHLAWSENAHPQYGPQLLFDIPWAISSRGAEWLVSLDAAKGDVSISGGIGLWGIAHLVYHEDGTVRCNGTQVARYAPLRKQSFAFRVTVPDRKVAVFVDGATTPVVTLDWARQERNLHALRIEGLLPGGHGQWPSSLIVDNIRIVLVKMPGDE
jgi:hypothetical protein